MSTTAALLPVFAQVALTLGLLFWLGARRVPLISSGALHPRDVALGEPNWPKKVTQISQSFSNQFELPVLFYLAVVLAIVANTVSTLFVVLSWAFVAARVAHAAVHVTNNHLGRRFAVFTIGLLILTVLWIVLFASVVVL